MSSLPEFRVLPAPGHWQQGCDLADPAWRAIAPLPPFHRADGSGHARYATTARVAYDAAALYVRFDCQDPDIWGTLTRRDDPIYDEEVVELFLAPGAETPVDYVEIEVSPLGVLFDALVHNPTGARADMSLDIGWDCPGLLAQVLRDPAHEQWSALLTVPWAPLHGADTLPTLWRANFYRIERPRNAAHEFSCWSPTLADPPDFHKPERFGILHLTG